MRYAQYYLDMVAADESMGAADPVALYVADERAFMPGNRNSFMKAKVRGKSGGFSGGSGMGGDGGGFGDQPESGGMNNGDKGRFRSATSQKHAARKKSQWQGSGKRSMNQSAFKEASLKVQDAYIMRSGRVAKHKNPRKTQKNENKMTVRAMQLARQAEEIGGLPVPKEAHRHGKIMHHALRQGGMNPTRVKWMGSRMHYLFPGEQREYEHAMKGRGLNARQAMEQYVRANHYEHQRLSPDEWDFGREDWKINQLHQSHQRMAERRGVPVTAKNYYRTKRDFGNKLVSERMLTIYPGKKSTIEGAYYRGRNYSPDYIDYLGPKINALRKQGLRQQPKKGGALNPNRFAAEEAKRTPYQSTHDDTLEERLDYLKKRGLA